MYEIQSKVYCFIRILSYSIQWGILWYLVQRLLDVLASHFRVPALALRAPPTELANVLVYASPPEQQADNNKNGEHDDIAEEIAAIIINLLVLERDGLRESGLWSSVHRLYNGMCWRFLLLSLGYHGGRGPGLGGWWYNRLRRVTTRLSVSIALKGT